MSSPSMEMMQAIYPDVPWRSAMQLHSLCMQSEMWVTKERKVMKIEELDTNHARNIVKYITRCAPLIKLAAEAWWMDQVERHDGGEMAHDALEDGCEEVTQMSASQYLEESPLYKALQKHIECPDISDDPRGRDDPSWDQPYT